MSDKGFVGLGMRQIRQKRNMSDRRLSRVPRLGGVHGGWSCCRAAGSTDGLDGPCQLLVEISTASMPALLLPEVAENSRQGRFNA